MELQIGYEVIRFIDQGNLTRIKMDYAKGTLLLQWLKENHRIEKEQLYQWIEMLVTQICLFHRCQKNQCYRYLSPESVVVTTDGRLYLLDLEAESNAFAIRDMQRRQMRQHFMKQEVYFRQNTQVETDLYSLGKTIQFIVSRVGPGLALTRKEERQIDRFIQMCLGNNSRKSEQNLNLIQKEIPKYKKTKNNRKWLIPIIAIILAALVLAYGLPHYLDEKSGRVGKSETAEKVGQEPPESSATEQENAIDSSEEGEPLEAAETRDTMSLLKQYLQNHTAEDNQRTIDEGTKLQQELAGYLASAYDREEEMEEALFYYRLVTHVEEHTERLEMAYARMTTIEEQLEQYEAARATYQEAVTACPESEELKIRYLTFICKHESEDVEQQNEDLKNILTEAPELKETEEFKKLQQEYGIKVEEEKVWIEKESGTSEG